MSKPKNSHNVHHKTFDLSQAIHSLILASSLVISPTIKAEDVSNKTTKHHYQISSGSLSHALSTFAGSSGILLSADAKLTDGKTSRGLEGEYTVEEGFTRLLAGTGLTHYFNGDNTVMLQATENQSLSDVETLPIVKVTGKVEHDPNDPYNTDYNRRNAATATKTDTPIMETPIAIQVIPKAVIHDQQGVQVGDAIKNVSGVFSGQTQGGFAEQFMIRGFNTNFSNYYDGFRFPASRLSLANIDHIEVVKGAAANLYGRIEPGGMINMVTKRPQATPYYSLEQRFGSYDLYQTLGDATGAINNDGSLLYRINFENLNKNSFRDFGFTDRVFVAPSLTWKISNSTQLDFDFMYSDEDTRDESGVVASTLTRRPVKIPISTYLGEPSTDKSNTKLYNSGVTLSHKFNDDWKLKAKFNYLKRDTNDPTTTPNRFINEANGVVGRSFYSSNATDDTYNGTVDIIGSFSTWGLKHKTLVGWDYYSIETNLTARSGNSNSINIYNPIYSPITPPPVNGYLNQPINWNGVYFQDQITILDKLHILGGGRYDWISSSSGFSTSSMDLALESSKKGQLDNQRFSPKVGLVYQPWDWLSLYGNYVESVGNLSSRIGSDGNVLPPEIGEQYEVGFKNSFFDNRLNSSVSVFQLTKQHQAYRLFPTNFYEPTGKTRSEGVEIDISGRITDNLSLIGSYAYTETSIVKATSNQGNQLWNVPRNAGSLWAKYDFLQDDLRGLSFGTGAYFQSQKQGNNANTYQLPGWGRLDAMIKYQLPFTQKAKTTLQFNVENLLDHEYYAASSGNQFFVNSGQPRTFMGSIKVEF